METASQEGIDRTKVKLTWRDLFALLLGREIETSNGMPRVVVRVGAWPNDVFRAMTPEERRKVFVRQVK